MGPSDRRIALVTGAGSGVGRASVKALLDGGFTVAMCGRRVDALEAVAAELDPGRDRTAVLPADVGKAEAVDGMFDAIESRFGRLDLLFNNAGMGAPPLPIDELTPAQWQSVVDVNLTGTFLCTRRAFRLMKTQRPRGGRIINNGSISAHAPRPFSSPYTATKHAITGLTRAVSLDGRAYDIACGQIDIGNADTEMAQTIKHGILQPHGAVVAEPVMDVDDVGRAVAFMAGLPLDSNVQFMTIMATKMPFVGRG